MLSASSARRWSRREAARERSTVETRQVLTYRRTQKTKAREGIPGFSHLRFACGRLVTQPNQSARACAGTMQVLVQAQQHAQAALLTDINPTIMVRLVGAKSTPRVGGEEPVEQDDIDRDDRSRKRYAAGPFTIPSSRRTVETPKPTTQASKLMQMRRNVSTRMRRISAAPIGTPMRTLGRICGMSRFDCDRDEAGREVRDRREARLGEADEPERRAELALVEALVVQHHRQRRPGNRRHRIEHAEAEAERQADRPSRTGSAAGSRPPARGSAAAARGRSTASATPG